MVHLNVASNGEMIYSTVKREDLALKKEVEGEAGEILYIWFDELCSDKSIYVNETVMVKCNIP